MDSLFSFPVGLLHPLVGSRTGAMPKMSCGLVSSPRLIKPIVPISSNGLTCELRSKGYETDPVGWAFDRGSRRRS
jgi:hypothetical protein